MVEAVGQTKVFFYFELCLRGGVSDRSRSRLYRKGDTRGETALRYQRGKTMLISIYGYDLRKLRGKKTLCEYYTQLVITGGQNHPSSAFYSLKKV